MLELYESELDMLCQLLPDDPARPQGGRPRTDKRKATGSASRNESTLVEPLFDFMVTVDFPERLIGDRAYDSDKLDATLAGLGVEMISPHRSNRRPENRTQDGRKLRRYKRHWTVERTVGWLQNYRRLCIRWAKSTAMFQGFVNLTCSILLMKQVLG